MIIKPKVSVCMITYGHEKYILQAIEGVLMQQCDFEVELILANDCSPDLTDQVIQDILTNHPRRSWIKYFKHQQNLGMMPNFIDALKKCEGKYVALCDGDDYWTDSLKLQKQVDFLEANEEYVIHSGNAIQHSENHNLSGKSIFNVKTDNSYRLEDFLANNNLVTCTVMFRNIRFEFPIDSNKAIFGDWFLYVILLKKSSGKAYRSLELFSVYRVHNGGVMGKLNSLNFCKAHIFQILIIHKYLEIKKMNQRTLNSLNTYFLPKFRIELYEKSFLKCIHTGIYNFRLSSWSMPFRKYLSVIKQYFCHRKI